MTNKPITQEEITKNQREAIKAITQFNKELSNKEVAEKLVKAGVMVMPKKYQYKQIIKIYKAINA